MDRKEISRRLLDLTLEIISLLSGEDYTIVKKTSGGTPIIHESGGWSRTPITEPFPLIHEQKILELTHKMMELLTGEVPVRCQDVAVYFSMEEWEYVGGYKDLYKEAMMEAPRPLTSPSKKRRENSNKDSEKNFMLSVDYKVEDEDIGQRSSGENLIAYNVHPGLHRTDLSYDLLEHEEPSADQSQIATTSTGQKEAKRYQCGECGKQFTQRSGLYTHRRIHTGEKPYSCSICGKCFAYKSLVVKHERIHTGEKPYSCPECGKCFTTKSDLVKHHRRHTGEKPYSCRECDKCFITKDILKVHQRSHTGEKPFKCSLCGKCFADKSGLSKHQLYHTGEKPFSCSECGKGFTSKSDLVKHERIHTGVKPYVCMECGKGFTCKSDLIKHERTHTGEKPYSCFKCGKSFKTISDLGKHERTHKP
ncbi:zinc finger protein 501-like isoform X1 [Bufo bufo]|uniref:zinc finger protein 501-like isoform X1 n=1 Tax=Bufo bufo TaxID=8384 RepID=UPI001ABE104D|nr:zinc finger protein 501-like isoform X1 [Bufo bufo]